MIDLMAAELILRQWLQAPAKPRCEYRGILWLEQHPQAREPLSSEEVDRCKTLLKEHAPTAWQSLFPNE